MLTNDTSQTVSDAKLDAETPRHVAVIMDGNGRWASRRSLPRTSGHQQGVKTVRDVVRWAGELGIEYLTLFSFSSENWRRPAEEVDFLMGLLKRFIRQDLAELHKAGVRVRIIGRRDDLDRDLLRLLEESEALTQDNNSLNLVVAFNYGSRNEIVRAVQTLVDAVACGDIKREDITEELLSSHMDTFGIPDPDLILRTSGEQRLSNFLLWQCAYSEFVFIDECWPDFGRDSLEKAIEQYRKRDRRFGRVAGQTGT